MNKYKKLYKNFSMIALGSFSSKFLIYLLLPLYTTALTTEEYGTADLIFTTVSLIIPIFTLQISEAVTRFTLDKNNSSVSVLIIGIKTTILGSIIFIILSPIILFFNSLKDYYLYFIIYYFVISFHGIISQYIRGMEKIKEYATSSFLNTIIVIILNIFFLKIIKNGIYGYLLSNIFGYLIASIYLFSCIRNIIPGIIKNKITVNLFKEMITFAIPLIPNSIFWWINNSSDKYILSWLSDLETVGIYSMSYKIPSILFMISTTFINAWQISSVEKFGTDEYIDFYTSIYKKYLFLNCVITSILILFIRPLASLFFKNEFYISWRYAPFLLLGYIFYSMAIFLGSIYTAAKKTKMIFFSTLISCVINILLNVILIPRYGGIGAAFATFVSYLIIFLIRIIHSHRIIILRVNHLRHIICFLLLLIQIYISLHTDILFNVYELLILLSIFILNTYEIKAIYKSITNFLKSNKK